MKVLFDYVAKLIAKNSDLEYENILSNLESPSNNLADIALPCFKFAQIMHTSPVEIASKLANNISDKNIAKIENVNGYLNFTFADRKSVV